MSMRNRAWLRMAACAALTVALGACADYLSRRDSITLSAGEAHARNRIVHIIDPRPADAANTDIPGDGQRTAEVMRAYSAGEYSTSGGSVQLSAD